MKITVGVLIIVVIAIAGYFLFTSDGRIQDTDLIDNSNQYSSEEQLTKKFLDFQHSFSAKDARENQDPQEKSQTYIMHEPNPFSDSLSEYEDVSSSISFKYYKSDLDEITNDLPGWGINKSISIIYDSKNQETNSKNLIFVYSDTSEDPAYYPEKTEDINKFSDDYAVNAGFVLIQREIKVDFANSYGFKQVFDRGYIHGDKDNPIFVSTGEYDAHAYVRYVLKSTKTGKILTIVSSELMLMQDGYEDQLNNIQKAERLLDTVAATLDF